MNIQFFIKYILFHIRHEHRRTVIGLLSLSLFVTAGVALGWPEPQVLRIQDPASEEGTNHSPSVTESTVDEEEKVDVEKTSVEMSNKRPWTAPDFSGQTSALGWTPEAFVVPAGLRERVDFWKSIYTKYTTDQGILHDSMHVSLVYSEVDFTSINSNTNSSEKQKRKLRRALVDDKKKEIRESVLRLAQVEKQLQKESSEEVLKQLSVEDRRLWDLFAKIEEPNKFQAALSRKRIRFQLGQKDRFIQGIYYSGRYLQEMEKIFVERGLPKELTRLPFVESSFNVKARSRVGASGIWQFMRYTGRKFMRINYAVDERNDPLRATEAAARLFKLNYDMLGKWSLAITGYNHGPTGVQKMVRKFNTDDIVELVDERHHRFGFASANFYSCFLAAVEVEKEASKYFGQVFWDSPADWQKIVLSKNVRAQSLKKWFDGNLEKAQEANPHLQRPFWAGHTNLGPKDFIRVPTAQLQIAMDDLANTKLVAVNTQALSGFDYYSINSGETLSEIAAQIGVSVRSLLEINGIENPRGLRAGQKILIPTKTSKD